MLSEFLGLWLQVELDQNATNSICWAWESSGRKSAICHFQYWASQNCHSQHWLRKNATQFICTLITMPFFLFSLFLFLFSIFWHLKGPKYPCSYLHVLWHQISTWSGRVRAARREHRACRIPGRQDFLGLSLDATPISRCRDAADCLNAACRQSPRRCAPPISSASCAAHHPVPQWRHGTQSFWTVLRFTFPLVCSFDSSSTKLLMWRMESVGSTFIIPDLLPVDNHWCINQNDDIPSYWEEFTTKVAHIM